VIEGFGAMDLQGGGEATRELKYLEQLVRWWFNFAPRRMFWLIFAHCAAKDSQ